MKTSSPMKQVSEEASHPTALRKMNRGVGFGTAEGWKFIETQQLETTQHSYRELKAGGMVSHDFGNS